MAEQLFHVGVKALIQNDQGKVLLLQADTSRHKFQKNVEAYWDIPGGRMEDNEDVLKTLRREVNEETGIKVFAQPPTFFTSVISKHRIPISADTTVGLVLMIYKVIVPQDSVIVISVEHTIFEWVDREEAARRLGNKYPPVFTKLLQDA